MTPPRRDKPLKPSIVYVDEMLHAIDLITRYLQGLTRSEFLAEGNDEKQDAVVRRFEILGEAASQFPASLRETYPMIPWRDMSDLRNRVIHAYGDVDYGVLWDTAQHDLPEVRTRLLELRRNLETTTEQSTPPES